MIHFDRLLRLAALLEKNAANPKGVKFNLFTWGKAPTESVSSVTTDCNTQACAFGLAAISGEFQKEGLAFHINPTPFFDEESQSEIINEIVPEFEGQTSWRAARAFFQLPDGDEQFLFYKASYHGPKKGAEAELAVAGRIRQYVADKQAL